MDLDIGWFMKHAQKLCNPNENVEVDVWVSKKVKEIFCIHEQLGVAFLENKMR